MRKIKLALAGVTAMLAFAAGCSGDESTRMNISATSWAFDASGGVKNISIDTDASSWKAELIEDATEWFSLTFNENSLTITAPANPTAEIKKASVRITAGTIKQDIALIQGGLPKIHFSMIPEKQDFQFNASGGKFVATIESNYPWRAIASQEWCELDADPKTGTLTVSAGSNTGDRRSARVAIIFGDEQNEDGFDFEVTQLTTAEDPYLALLGTWNLYSDVWWMNEELLPEGERASCTIEADVLNESFIMRNLFIEDSSLQIYFNPADGYIEIPLGWLVKTANYRYYLAETQISSAGGRNQLGYIYGGPNPNRTTISLSGFQTGWGIGLVATDGTNYYMVGNTPYAQGSEIIFNKASGQPSPQDGWYSIPSLSSGAAQPTTPDIPGSGAFSGTVNLQ